jgi:hypothetical protein
MALACTDDNCSKSFHANAGDERRGENHDEGYHGNDVGEHTQPASGVVGTSSACYPSHRAEIKFQ